MKTFDTILVASLLVIGATPITVFADDNIAACEIVVQQPVFSPDEKEKEKENGKDKGEETTKAADENSHAPMIATFIPAEDFVYSVFDGEDGHMTEVDGHSIQAVMCKRRYLVPTEFDLRLIETRIPLYLSQNFDSPDSDLMAVYYKDEEFQYQYTGSDLPEDSLEILKVRMATLNAPAEK